jgi:peptidoglycan hydrolase-like protein with peptidoglycan-binding domain
MNKTRITYLFYVLAMVTLVAIGGWSVGSRIESPAEVAARTAPPTASPILVPVEERVLSTNVVTRGTARFGLPQPIFLAPSALKANSAGWITTLPALNTPFKEGDVILTSSGRPVLVLRGEIPAYRDLVPGSAGKDVLQLEQGLQRLGFDPGPQDGTYDEQTSTAVGKWYESKGHVPFWPTPDQLTAIRILEQALEDARKSKMVVDSTAASADLAVETARMKAQLADKTASADIQAGIAERALIALDPRQLATARSAADAKIEVARAALKAARTEGELTYQAAMEAKKVAEYDAQLAAERVDRLTTDLEMAKRKLGVQVPIDEIVFLPALPVRVEQVTSVVGGAASGHVLSVTDNQITIDAALPLDAAPLVKPGMTVDIDEQSLGIKTKGVVEFVDKTPGTHGVDGYHIYCAVRVDETPMPLQGFSLRLTIPVRSTKQAVITVPLSAVSFAADGKSRVQVQKGDMFESVVVEPGLAADGYVEVVPVSGRLDSGQLVVIGIDGNEVKNAKVR